MSVEQRSKCGKGWCVENEKLIVQVRVYTKISNSRSYAHRDFLSTTFFEILAIYGSW